MKNFFVYSSTGNSLVEVIVATGALVFVLVGVVSGMILAVRNSSYSNRQAQATKHTQETIEMFRHFYLALGWESFYEEMLADSPGSVDFTYCLPSLISDPDPDQAAVQFRNLSSGGSCTAEIPNTPFVREVFVHRGAVTDPLEIEVEVRWTEGNSLNTAHSTVELYQRYGN